MAKYWADLKQGELDKMDKSRLVAVLSLGAMEQHGPHLPLSVDALIAEQMVAKTLPLLADTPALFLPNLAYGFSPEHQSFAGTISLNASTCIALWSEIAQNLHRAGVKKLLFFNAHGGHVGLMDTVGRTLRAELGMLVYSSSWFDLVADSVWQTHFDATAKQNDVHAGELETSLMLALAPESVDLAKALDFKSTATQTKAENPMLGQGKSKRSWAIEDYNRSGAVGNAAAASAEKGQILLAAASSGLAQLIGEISRLDWSEAKQI